MLTALKLVDYFANDNDVIDDYGDVIDDDDYDKNFN